MISLIEVNSGEYIGVSCMEITSIPDISVIRSGYSESVDIEKEYINYFENLSSEIYQNYKYIISQNQNAEIVMELLWMTEPVSNQSYKARIRPFIIIRAVSGDEISVKAIVEQVYGLYESALKLGKYSFEEKEFNKLEELISKVQIDDCVAVVKEEREEILDNQLLPTVYSIDVFDSYARDMSSFINELTQHPYSMVSFQLFPTQINIEEKTGITRIAQLLDTLSKGIMTQGLGNVSISAAGIWLNCINIIRLQA